ncbi:hypothetical protein VTL71DRAFT_3116 [Oculimacula yallundae]|uniref:HMG box domain-containing protein n=3 Tax=Oculimacula yallundae TaxID=86028 RepID=A0ABR4C827_9HELO
MSSQFSFPPGHVVPAPAQLYAGQLQGFPVSSVPLQPNEFTHWFETTVALEHANLKCLMTISLAKLSGWDSRVRAYMVEVYRKISGHEDIIIVRCNKLPRVFIGPRQYFDRNVKYAEVAGDLPIIVEDDATVFSNFNTNPEAHDHFSAPEDAPSSAGPDTNNGNVPPVPITTATRRGARNGVARPPNCFILFRQHLHPLVVRDNPGVHNNVISAIISKMWHAAPASIIAQYQELAKQAKAQHLANNPNYQYQPRKSSEKKRRMTKKKAATLERAAAQTGPYTFAAGSTFEAILPTDSATRTDIVNHNLSVTYPNMEPQGSGSDIMKPDTFSEVQTDELQSSAEAFALLNAGPRDDFEVQITADHPEIVYLDQAILDENRAIAFAGVTETQQEFADMYEMINGVNVGGPPELEGFTTISNDLYVYDPPTYDHDLHGLFYGTD